MRFLEKEPKDPAAAAFEELKGEIRTGLGERYHASKSCEAPSRTSAAKPQELINHGYRVNCIQASPDVANAALEYWGLDKSRQNQVRYVNSTHVVS